MIQLYTDASHLQTMTFDQLLGCAQSSYGKMFRAIEQMEQNTGTDSVQESRYKSAVEQYDRHRAWFRTVAREVFNNRPCKEWDQFTAAFPLTAPTSVWFSNN